VLELCEFWHTNACVLARGLLPCRFAFEYESGPCVSTSTHIHTVARHLRIPASHLLLLTPPPPRALSHPPHSSHLHGRTKTSICSLNLSPRPYRLFAIQLRRV
jgi:hypothetical protein